MMRLSKHKLFLFISKYIPVALAIGIFINLLLSLFYKTVLLVNFFFGGSLVVSFLLYLISYTFEFCKWHRILIHYITFYYTLLVIDYYICSLSNTILTNLYFLNIASAGIFVYAHLNRKTK